MRAIHIPLLVYSLSLLSVASGQITGASLGSFGPLPTSTEAPPPTTETTSSTSTSSSSEETSAIPTSTTSTTSSTEITPTESTPTSTASSAPGGSSSAAATTTAPPTTTHKTSPTVKVITTVQSGGNQVLTTLTITSEATGTSGPDSTAVPGLNKGNGDSGSSGLSDDQKKIVIGVVVGVGGAIVIGSVIAVFWRISSRRRKAAQNDDVTDLMSGTAVGTGAREKAPSPGAGGTPFRSTLDQYHNPGPVNAASNF